MLNYIDLTHFGDETLIENVHDIHPGYPPSPHVSYLPVPVSNNYHHHPPGHDHYGIPLETTHITNYISTDRKGKSTSNYY